MPTVDIDGITTRYEISGLGPPILMKTPGGFDSAIEKWSTTWPWQHFLPLQTFARQDVDRYLAMVLVSCHSLFDRDTIPGAEPEELLALKLPTLIPPGHTEAHATSCARYLEECIPGADYWDVHLESQPPDLIRDRILDFFATPAGAGVYA
jgi:hypothetical protein